MLINLSKSQKTLKLDRNMLDTLRFFLLVLDETNLIIESINPQTEDEKKYQKIEVKKHTPEFTKAKIKVNDNNNELFDETFLFENSNWFLKKVGNFNKLFEINEKIKFVSDALHDIEFSNHTSDSSFRFYTFQYLEELKKNNGKTNEQKQIDEKKAQMIISMFKELYTNYFKSFHYVNGEKFKLRRYYIDSILSDNDGLLLCPSCLGDLNIHSLQIDHYYPQSKFPVLSIHPDNLIPICNLCNTSVSGVGKGESIPLDLSSEENKDISLDSIYLPYKSSAHKKFVGKVKSEKNVKDKTMFPFLLEECEIESNRMTLFSDLYKLEKKWSIKIPSIHMNIFIRSLMHFRAFGHKDLTLNHSNLKEYLIKTYILNHGDHVLKLPDVMITSSYVMWLIQSKDSLDAFINELKHSMALEGNSELPYFFKENFYL